MRILIMSNAPWAATGYGKQVKLFASRIKSLGHEVAIFAYFGLEGALIHMDGIPIYPKSTHPFGLDIVTEHARHFQADIVLTLTDSWVIEPQAIKPRWVGWAPVDHDPLPVPVAVAMSQMYQCIVYSESAAQECRRAGIDAIYVPHGIDFNEYRPLAQDATSYEQLLKDLQWPTSSFIVGLVAMNKDNPSRKALDEQFKAFAIFKQRHPDALLYAHSSLSISPGSQGVNLLALCEDVGLDPSKDVIFPNQYLLYLGYPEEYMVKVYSAINVLLSATKGEGFCVPILEAQACGAPVIAGGWTAMPELVHNGYVLSQDRARAHRTQLRSFQFVPDVEEIVEALEEIYTRGGREVPEAIQRYDVDNVTQNYWRPALEAIETRIQEEAV